MQQAAELGDDPNELDLDLSYCPVLDLSMIGL